MAGQHGSTGEAIATRTKEHGVACDLCTKVAPVGAEVVDGKTRMGPWANMCEDCFSLYGIGLGTGRGQRYRVIPKVR